MYELTYSPQAAKALKKLDFKAQERIVAALERIRIRPERFVTKLVGEEFYRLRVGDYRVILEIDNGNLIILVIKVGHRQNIYD
jgi:mRNA interferase RelE/StbE